MAGKRNLLVTLADSNYVVQARQLFSSAYWNAGWDGDCMLLAHNIPENELEWFHQKGILIKKCEPLHDEEIGKGYSPIVLDKFYLFSTEFKKWEKIIYLDSDIIINGPLYSITKINGFSAVVSTLKLKEQFNQGSNAFTELSGKYNLAGKSCNTGIMAFSTSIIKDDTFLKLKEIFNSFYASILYADEAVLNLYFYGHWKKLPRVFGLDVNLLLNFNIRKKNIKSIVLHFIRNEFSGIKPWDPASPYYPEWDYNLKRSDDIDLKSIQKMKKWSSFKIHCYSSLYDFYFFIFYFYYCNRTIKAIRRTVVSIIHLPERVLGLAGSLIKRINPWLYSRIKKILKAPDKQK